MPGADPGVCSIYVPAQGGIFITVSRQMLEARRMSETWLDKEGRLLLKKP